MGTATSAEMMPRGRYGGPVTVAYVDSLGAGMICHGHSPLGIELRA